MSDRNQGKPDADKQPNTAIEKDGAVQPTDAELDRVEGGVIRQPPESGIIPCFPPTSPMSCD